jgi:hypothetical protein
MPQVKKPGHKYPEEKQKDESNSKRHRQNTDQILVVS